MVFVTDNIVTYSWIERTTEWSHTNDSIILTSAITSSTPAPIASSSVENVVVITEESDPTIPLEELTTPYGPAASVVIALVLLCVIVGTIVGNVLVCVAVCLVRKLRRPCNYLLVSLAVSDLCVAILVMPVALLYEILGRWSFGPVICDLWVSFDVLSCTASILNLCMISVDRYYAITKPLEYGVKRTPRRMIACVSLVWLGSACISLPPLLILGNEHGEDGTSCSVCQNFGYQIYATLGSFYIPLSVMIVVYHKIFQAARKIVLEERRAQSHLRLTSSNMAADDHHLNPQQYLHNPASQQPLAPIISDKIVVVTEISKNGNATPETRLASPVRSGGAASDGGNNSISWQPGMQPNRDRNSSASTNTNASVNESTVSRCFGSHRKRRNQQDVEHPLTSGGDGITNIGGGSKSANKRDSTLSNEQATSSGRKKLLQQPHVMSKSKLRFTLAKERKASTTLGIIMSAFTICWLPFFVLALVRPFLMNKDGIPQSLSSLFLWLGYANSLLNPIIYATLNKDFRKPFQQILYFRCSSLNLMMREEFYHSQYGDPNLTIAGPTTRHRAEEIHFYGASDEFGGNGGGMQYNRVGANSGDYHECIVPPTASTQLGPITTAEDENDTYTSEHDESFL